MGQTAEIIDITPAGGDKLPPLSGRERKRRAELERIISQEISSFIRVGTALAEIRESKLYREEHPTFEEYLQVAWDMGRRTGYQYIEGAEVVRNLRTNCAQISWYPANEAQARPLVGLTPEQQVEAWTKAVQAAPEGKITARHVADIAKQIKGEPVRRAVEKARKAREYGDRISPEFQAALDALLDLVNEEALSGWKTTDQRHAARLLRGVLTAIEGEES